MACATEHKAIGQLLCLPSFALSIIAFCMAVPFELRWLSVLSLGDTTRCLLKKNTHALKLVFLEPDFWVSAITVVLAMVFGVAPSFEYDAGVCVFLACFAYSFTVTVLLCTLTKRRCLRSDTDL